MHPLLTLWLIVLGSTVLLSGFFYLAENYSHIIGNFYFLTGAFLFSYIVYLVLLKIQNRNKRKTRQD